MAKRPDFSFRLGNGKIVTTWGDFRKFVLSQVGDAADADRLQSVAQRYKREGKCPADLCEDMANVARSGRLPA
jgi:hypothetical protein